MNKEDYFKYYIQGSDHYLLPKDIFDELFDEIVNWKNESQQLKNDYSKVVHESTEHESKVYELQEENQRLKEMKYKTLIDLQDRIDRAIECIDSLLPCIHDEELLDDLLKILKGVKDD